MGPAAPFISMAAPYVGTAATLFGAYNQYEAGKEAEKEAQMLTDQQVRDERLRSDAEQAERRARAAASGIQPSGSSQLFMQTAAEQDDQRLKWMRRTGNVRADALKSQGRAGAFGTLSRIPGYWM